MLKNIRFIMVGLILSVLITIPVLAAPITTGEPGPDFKTWIPATLTYSFEPKNIRKRIFYRSDNPSVWGYTLSLKLQDGNEQLLLKVWNIKKSNNNTSDFSDRWSRFSSFFYVDQKSEDDTGSVESALWYGGNDWLIGAKGMMPSYTDKPEIFANYLIIEILSVERFLYEACKNGKLYDNTDCDQWLKEKPARLSIPAYYFQ